MNNDNSMLNRTSYRVQWNGGNSAANSDDSQIYLINSHSTSVLAELLCHTVFVTDQQLAIAGIFLTIKFSLGVTKLNVQDHWADMI